MDPELLPEAHAYFKTWRTRFLLLCFGFLAVGIGLAYLKLDGVCVAAAIGSGVLSLYCYSSYAGCRDAVDDLAKEIVRQQRLGALRRPESDTP